MEVVGLNPIPVYLSHIQAKNKNLASETLKSKKKKQAAERRQQHHKAQKHRTSQRHSQNQTK